MAVPNWFCVDDSACGWVFTRGELSASVDTFLVDANMFIGTVLVFNTLWWRNWQTLPVWVSSEPDVAPALSYVVLNQALGVGRGARVVDLARVNTFPVLAGLVGWTLRIGSAANNNTSNKWVSLISFPAPAVGLVGLRVAFGVVSTRVFNQTGVDAIAFYACLPVFAFWV